MQPDLVYDVGMNDGKDTAYYLWKGYRVVAVEADPALVERARERFKDAIAAGRLTLLNIAVGAVDSTATFWVCERNSEWNSFDKTVATSQGSSAHGIEVPVREFGGVLREYGMPFYLKVDIEGFDHYCLAALEGADLPKYVSFEMCRLEELGMLSKAGYTRFKVIGQRGFTAHSAARTRSLLRTCGRLGREYGSVRGEAVKAVLRQYPALHGLLAAPKQLLRSMRGTRSPGAGVAAVPAPGAAWRFEMGSSGPFGEDTPGAWMSLDEAAYAWLDYWLNEGRYLPLAGRNWFDIHARRPLAGEQEDARESPMSLRS